MDHQGGLLKINLFFLILVLLLLFSWEQYLSNCGFAFLGVAFSASLNYLGRKVYSGFYPGYREQPTAYLNTILQAWEVEA